MEYINEIAFHKGVRDEVPNKELAARLADEENRDGINEIAGYLWDKNKSVASDCIAVLYHVGYIKPELIAGYVDEFLKLLESKVNRMVWGAMIALATIADLRSDVIWRNLGLVLDVIRKGTLITEVWGLKVLVKLAISSPEYKTKLIATLFEYLEGCRPIDFATRIETFIPAMSEPVDKEKALKIIENKRDELKDSQKKKVDRILKKWV